ncbi:hypothetical protein PJ384_005465, partial [Escherichia coli]|nr:hypothetical protein [Escherichia coli]
MNNSSNTTTRNTLSPVESACHALLDFIAREVFENKAPEEDVRERCKVFTALLNEGFKALLDEAGLNLSNLRKQCEELESQITRLDSQSDAICRRGAQIERFIGHHLPFFDLNKVFDTASQSCEPAPSPAQSAVSSSQPSNLSEQ